LFTLLYLKQISVQGETLLHVVFNLYFQQTQSLGKAAEVIRNEAVKLSDEDEQHMSLSLRCENANIDDEITKIGSAEAPEMDTEKVS
jgi:hypothetical protein